MGDRGNIVIQYDGNETTDPTEIYLYTHWSGSALPEILARALNRGKSRWSDPPYLARIIFSEMIQNEVLEETGFGIAPYECDNENPVLYVDTERQMVREDAEKPVSYEAFVTAFLPTTGTEERQ